MNALKVTLSAFGQAHRFIWEEGFLKMLYVPLLLTVLYFPVMVGACYFSAAMFVEFFEGQLGLDGDYGGWAWVEWLAEIILFLGIGVLGVITYRTVVLLFYSLYLDRIAERVEKDITGDVIECKRPPSQILKRMLVVAIITILGTVLMLLIELGANMVPVIGGLIALALIIPCEMFLTGIGFVDNALIKARHAAAHTGLPAIADDSGLAVDALAGAPGVHSARYAGTHGDDNANNDKLLAALEGLPAEQRGAAFHCCLVATRGAEDPVPVIAHGVWRGWILDAVRGDGGFGYDPLFWVDSENASAAELTATRKNEISHRGRAMHQLVEQLRAHGHGD